jgi:glutamyl-tRNA synthetase
MGLRDQIPLPPLPTLFESNSSFADVQLIFDALDDYLAYR